MEVVITAVELAAAIEVADAEISVAALEVAAADVSVAVTGQIVV